MPHLPPVLRDPSALALVFIGGTAGTTLRLLLEEWFPAQPGRWPTTTFAINLVGALVLAALLEYLASSSRVDEEVGRRIRLFGGTGICGGFTTYSTFSDEQVLLIRDGHLPLALTYGTATLIFGAIGTVIGLLVGAHLAGRGEPTEPDVVDPDTAP
ncbi:fluoride efflux transporter FluC [Gordonia crocea]|uniref:Fluoride-specific ion channel FluC n=1 Tax=Gordonia crocea TaxID=589162 RepID=A0A7M3SUG3_9ACTN|nr:CrcB family protein [Gordonia crocea]GED96287.1 hypothetical protein nbrc107697_03260 [Gordonia crocea]